MSKGGSWRCHNDTRGTEAILRKHHPDCDLATTLGFFASQGGHCDCEVILNVRPLGGEGYDWLIDRALDLRGDRHADPRRAPAGGELDRLRAGIPERLAWIWWTP